MHYIDPAWAWIGACKTIQSTTLHVMHRRWPNYNTNRFRTRCTKQSSFTCAGNKQLTLGVLENKQLSPTSIQTQLKHPQHHYRPLPHYQLWDSSCPIHASDLLTSLSTAMADNSPHCLLCLEMAHFASCCNFNGPILHAPHESAVC